MSKSLVIGDLTQSPASLPFLEAVAEDVTESSNPIIIQLIRQATNYLETPTTSLLINTKKKNIYYFEEFKHLGISCLRNQKLRLNVKAKYIPII